MFSRMVRILQCRNLQKFSRINASSVRGYTEIANRLCTNTSIPSSALLQGLSSKFPEHSDAILKVLANNRQLQETECSSWISFVEDLTFYGFQVPDCLLIISKEPQALDISRYDLKAILSAWHESPLGNEFMKLLLLNSPQLLFLPVDNLKKRIPRLHHFINKPKSLLLLLLQCPNVLTEQWTYVESKITYLTDVMRVDKSEILRSCALNKTLEHIKIRHTLLDKCGLYVAPHKYEHKRVKNEKTAFKNPPLKRIVDNEDISFARKICKISIEEYFVYKNIFKEEAHQSEGEYNSSSDSDSEED